MNETLKTIAGRYSCRAFADTPPAEEQVKAIIDAALASPSAINIQPWHITVVLDKAFIDELDADGLALLAAMEDQTRYNRIMSRGGKMLYNAPCLILITIDGSKWAQIDSGIMCQNIALASHSLGLGCCIVGLGGIPLQGPRGDEFKKRLKIPEGYEFAIGVLVGTALSAQDPHELDTSKVTYIR